jgi:ankyrin repeat protein
MDLLMQMTDLPGTRPDSPWQRRAKRSHATPFECSLGRDRVGIARMLLDHGFDPSRSDRWGRTPLHDAATAEAARITDLLLDRGGDVNARDRDRWTPLHWAAFSYGPDAEETVRTLLRGGADVNARASQRKTVPAAPGVIFFAQGTTPLLMAAEHQHWAVVRALIEANADPAIPDSTGETARSRVRTNPGAPADIIALMSRYEEDRNSLTSHVGR